MKTRFSRTALLLAFSFFFLQNQGFSQWQSVNTPEIPAALAEIRTVGNLLVVTAFQEGIYRSADSGNSWELATNGLPADQNWTALEGTPDDGIYAGGAGVIYKSTDNGDSWQPTGALTIGFGSIIRDIELHEGKVYATVGFYLQVSADQGQTWTVLANFGNGIARNIFLRGNEIFVAVNSGTNAGLQYSPDGGQNWQKISNAEMGGVACVGMKGDRLFAYGNTTDQIHFTDDLGANWTQGTGLPPLTLVSNILPLGDHVYTCNAGGVYVSTDDGFTWDFAGSGFPRNTVCRSLTLAPNGDVVAASFRGAYKSTDNVATWSLASDGIKTERLRVLGMTDFSSQFFIGGGNFYFSSADAGSNWQEHAVDLPLNASVFYLVNAGDKLFGGGVDNLVQLENDGTWKDLTDILPGNFVSAMATDGSHLFVGTPVGAHRLLDSGNAWEHLTPTTSFEVNAIGFHDNFIFAGSDGDNFHRAEKGSTTWISVASGIADTFEIVGFLADGDSIFLHGFPGAYFSTDNGTSWNIFQIPGADTSEVRLLYRQDSALLAVVADRILASFDGGGVWQDKSEGLPEGIAINVFLEKDGYLYLGSDLGIYRNQISELTTGAPETAAAGSLQVFPNPSSGRFFLETNEAISSPATLTVTDALGRQILSQTIENQVGKMGFEMPEGASGVYQITLLSGEKRWVGRLLVN